MVNIKIVISEIEYGKSLAELFPLGMEKCSKMENPNLAVRFLLKMGDASMTAALGILNRISADAKGELICRLVNLYCQEIRSALNELLLKDELGKNISIGGLCMAQDTEKHLVLIGSDIKIDYNGLIKNGAVKQKLGSLAGEAVKKTMFGGSDALRKVAEDVAAPVAEFAVGSAPGLVSELIEKKAVSIIGRQENKDRLLGMAESALAEKGLFVCLRDFVSWRESSAKLQGDEIMKNVKEGKLELSPALEDELLDALAGYLKSVEGCVPKGG